MTTTKLVNSLRKWAGLLILGSLAPLHVAAGEAAGTLRVDFENALLSVSAEQVPVTDVLQEIANKAGLRLVQHVVIDRAVSLDIEGATLLDALDEILDNESYQLYQNVTDVVPGMLWVFADGSSTTPFPAFFLEAVLTHGDYAEKREAIRELRRMATPEAVQVLSVALSDEDKRIPGVAMEALEQIGGDEAMAAIASATASADPWVRSEAVNALSSGDSESALEYLNLAFSDPDPNVRLAVVEAFADNTNGQAVAVLRSAINDADPMVRMHAVEALQAMGGEMAFRVLMQARDDDNEEVQEAAEESLSFMMQEP